jgi:1-acyl-sn-glycerol-3-phosphate acyltransferase
LKKIALNIYFWPTFFFFTIISLVLFPFLLLFNTFVARKPRAQFVRLLLHIHGLVIVRFIPFIAPVTIEDRSGGFEPPVIFVANHCSAVDPYIVSILPFEVVVITSWPFKIPIFNKIMKMAEYICSEDGWSNINIQARQLLERGCSIFVWPEGHRSRDGELHRFKKGAFLLASETNKKIIPLCVTGTYKLLQPGKRFLTPSRVKMIILPPIYPGNHTSDNDESSFLRDKAREVIAKELENQN